MVITEKQNLQITQTDRRHRRMLERMNRVLVSPRLLNRGRSEWNSQSQTLRSMDLFGLDRDAIDTNGNPSIFQSLFQSVFDSLSPRSPTPHPNLSGDHCRTAVLSSQQTTMETGEGESEKGVRIIPITFLDQSGNSISAEKNRSQEVASMEPILIPDLDEGEDSTIGNPEVIECRDTDTFPPKLTHKTCASHVSNVDDVDCDTNFTPLTNVDSCMDVIDCDTIRIPVDNDKVSDTDIDTRVDKNIDIETSHLMESNVTSLVRQSLPRLSLLRRSKVNNDNNVNKNNSISDEVVVLDCANSDEKSQGLRTGRSNKDTLVGGANKVLGDTGPDDYYKGSNLDLPPGATYLSGQVSTSLDVHSHSDEEKPVNEVPNYPIYSFLKKKLMKECRQIDYIKGDGNCFFRALSKQLYGSERYHIVLRNLIVDIIATNKNKFSQFVDGGDVQDHVERMSQEQSWATTCEIYAAATLLQRDVFMLTPDHLNQTYSWLLFKPVFKMDTQHSNIESHPCYLTLCNTNGNHYDRIVGEHGGCNCFLPHPELDGVSYSVDLTC